MDKGIMSIEINSIFIRYRACQCYLPQDPSEESGNVNGYSGKPRLKKPTISGTSD